MNWFQFIGISTDIIFGYRHLFFGISIYRLIIIIPKSYSLKPQNVQIEKTVFFRHYLFRISVHFLYIHETKKKQLGTKYRYLVNTIILVVSVFDNFFRYDRYYRNPFSEWNPKFCGIFFHLDTSTKEERYKLLLSHWLRGSLFILSSILKSKLNYW